MAVDWTQAVIGIGSAVIGSAVTGAIWYGALKAWMARREEREEAIREDVKDHEARIRYLERHSSQPYDYPVRG